jgi:hypothetical protein
MERIYILPYKSTAYIAELIFCQIRKLQGNENYNTLDFLIICAHCSGAVADKSSSHE